MTSWKYSDKEWRERFNLGLETVDEGELVSEFKDWVQKNEYSFLRNEETKDIIWTLNSKRGNDTYANKQKHKFDSIQEAFSNKDFDFPANKKGFRPGAVRYTYALFLTFTIDPNHYTKCEAWSSVTGMLNQFKAYLTKFLGSEYSSFTVKEANSSGYPAPHMILLLDDPVLAFLHKKKSGSSWRIQDRNIVNILHDAWARYAFGSFIDIQAIVGGSMGSAGSVAYYLTKYVGKSVDLHNMTAVFTHAYQKLFNLRDVVSKSFKERLDMDYDTIRLDYNMNELKPLKNRISEIDREIRAFGHFVPDLYKEKEDLLGRIKDIESSRPPVLWRFVDGITLRSDSSYDVQRFINKLTSLQIEFKSPHRG